MEGQNGCTLAGELRDTRGLWGHRDLLRHSPPKGTQFPGDSHDHSIGVFAAGAQLAIAFTEPPLGFPTDILDGFGHLVQTPWEVTTDLGGIAVSPGTFAEGPARVGMAGFGDRALVAMVSRGIFCGCQAEVTHPLAGRVETGKVAQFGYDGDCNRELDAAQGLECVDDGTEAPGLHAVVEFLCEPGKTCAVVRHGSDVFLENDWLRGRGTDHRTKPAEMGWAPGGLARVAAIVAQEKGFEAMLGCLEIAQRIFTGTTEVTDGFVRDLWDINGREVARAHQAGQLHGITPVRFDSIPRLFRDERRGNDPADVTFFGEIAVEPIPTRACFIDKHQMLAFRLPFPAELVDIALACTDSAEVDDVSMVFLRDIGDGNRVFMDIHSDVERARLCHG
jgi:hypothetical protein